MGENWKGPYHCPDCLNKHECVSDCQRRMAREQLDLIKKQLRVIE